MEVKDVFFTPNTSGNPGGHITILVGSHSEFAANTFVSKMKKKWGVRTDIGGGKFIVSIPKNDMDNLTKIQNSAQVTLELL